MRAILAFSAVGSLREEIAPGDFVLPTQIIDRTKGVRPASFFEGTTVVAHAAFGDPFAGKLIGWLEGRVRKVLEEAGEGEDADAEADTGRSKRKGAKAGTGARARGRPRKRRKTTKFLTQDQLMFVEPGRDSRSRIKSSVYVHSSADESE